MRTPVIITGSLWRARGWLELKGDFLTGELFEPAGLAVDELYLWHHRLRTRIVCVAASRSRPKEARKPPTVHMNRTLSRTIDTRRGRRRGGLAPLSWLADLPTP